MVYLFQMLMISEHYGAWLVFWLTYIGASFLFPEDHVKTRPIAKITKFKVWLQLLQNCLVTGLTIPLISYIPTIPIGIFQNNSMNWFSSPLKLALVSLLAEAWFYYSHRLMHTRWLYRWHADHHAFIRPYALAGLYCSSVEMILIIQMAMAVPYQLMGLNFDEVIIANIVVALTTLKGHAGFYYRDDNPWWLPKWLGTSLDHDIHHETLTSNFGILYLLDRIHGTHRASLDHYTPMRK